MARTCLIYWYDAIPHLPDPVYGPQALNTRTCINRLAADVFHSAGPHGNLFSPQLRQLRKTKVEVLEKIQLNRPTRYKIDQGRNSWQWVSEAYMALFLPTPPGFKEIAFHSSRVLNRGDLNFCVLSTLFQEAENIKPHKITSEKLAPERQ